MPVPGLYWADAASIGPVQARYWQLMAYLHGPSFPTILLAKNMMVTYPVTMPVLGLYWSDAGSIGPVQARYWHITACLWCTGLVQGKHMLTE